MAPYTEIQDNLALAQNAYSQAVAQVTEAQVTHALVSAIAERMVTVCALAELSDALHTVVEEVVLARAVLADSAEGASGLLASQVTSAAQTPPADAGAGPSTSTEPVWGSAEHIQQEQERADRAIRLANDVAVELELELPRGHVPPFEIILQRTEYLLLGDYAYNASDEHVRMRMREYFAMY